MYIREGALERLLKASRALPAGWRFKLWDIWRPVRLQQAIFDRYAAELAARQPALSEQELFLQASKFVYPPGRDALFPPLHATGGAVDLTILDDQERPLPMGTAFDDFTQAAHTDYFETHEGTSCRDNRRLLYACMTAVGFTNLPSEWWHYDYGTNFWSYYTSEPAIYTGILSEG